MELTECRIIPAGVSRPRAGSAPFIPTQLSPVRPGAGCPFFPRQSRQRQSEPRSLRVLQRRCTSGVLQQNQCGVTFPFGETGRLKTLNATGTDQRQVWSRSEWSNSISHFLAWDQYIYRNVRVIPLPRPFWKAMHWPAYIRGADESPVLTYFPCSLSVNLKLTVIMQSSHCWV